MQQCITGYMFHRKPLYVAIAQRKEDRQAQLQIQYANYMPGFAGPTSVIPGVYPPFYYATPSGTMSQVPRLMYQPMPMRHGWRANAYAPQARPALQPSMSPYVSTKFFI